MVHLMRPAYRHGVTVVGVPEDFETLVDEDVVDKKVGPTVAKNAYPNGQSGFEYVVAPKQKEPDAVRRIHDKEQVIAFKPRIVVFFVVVLVPRPQKSVHDVFVAQPGYRFHGHKSNYPNRDLYPECHFKSG